MMKFPLLKELQRLPLPPQGQTSAQTRYLTPSTTAAQRLRALGRSCPETIIGGNGAALRIRPNAMLDVNTASAADLDAVPQLRGHGFEIVRYREERGRFDSLRQLDEVPGLTGKWDGAEAEVEIG